MRLFFAVEVPEDIKSQILAAQQEIAKHLPPKGFRLTKPEMLHVTLAFLGEVSEASLDEVKTNAAEVFSTIEPVPLNFGGLGGFPKIKHPKVLWFGVEEEGYKRFDQGAPMATAGRRIFKSCHHLSDHEMEEEVLLHVTVARSSGGRAVMTKEVDEMMMLFPIEDSVAFGTSMPSSVVLYQSTLNQSGPLQHVPLARFPLKS